MVNDIIMLYSRKNFIGRRSDDHISRRVSLLPIVLPLVLLLPTFVSSFILNAEDRALRSLEPEKFYYWILLTRFICDLSTLLRVLVPG